MRLVKVKDENDLGMFSTPIEAHRAWQLGKIQVIENEINFLKIINFKNSHVIDALRLRINRLAFDYQTGAETVVIDGGCL